MVRPYLELSVYSLHTRKNTTKSNKNDYITVNLSYESRLETLAVIFYITCQFVFSKVLLDFLISVVARLSASL